PGGVFRVDEGADVGNPERPEDLFAPRRGKPVILVLHIVVGDYGRHGSPSVSCGQRPGRPYTQMLHSCTGKVPSNRRYPARNPRERGRLSTCQKFLICAEYPAGPILDYSARVSGCSGLRTLSHAAPSGRATLATMRSGRSVWA